MPKSENVAVFNPLVLALPAWHPDGHDGDVDGYRIPFVFPENRESGRKPNRDAYIRVFPSDGAGGSWRAALRNCQDHAETAEQARALAGAWIRAAEVLENVSKPPTCPHCGNRDAHHEQCPTRLGEVDAEVIDDDEDQDDERPFAVGDRIRIIDGLGIHLWRLATVTELGTGIGEGWVEIEFDTDDDSGDAGARITIQETSIEKFGPRVHLTEETATPCNTGGPLL